MDAFELSNLIEQQQQSGRPYLEFLRVSSMSVGIYALPAGAVDTQQPHTEDEVYYVVSGRWHRWVEWQSADSSSCSAC